MTALIRDPIINVINEGIKRDIRVALDNKCYRAATILIYAAMDAMAYLGIPESQEEVGKADFITWAAAHIRLPGKEQLTGEDLYGARCAMLHAYGVRSRMSRGGRCRLIGYMDKSNPPLRYNATVSQELVLVSVPALADALFAGIDRYLVAIFSDKRRGALVEERLKGLVHALSTEGKLGDSGGNLTDDSGRT